MSNPTVTISQGRMVVEGLPVIENMNVKFCNYCEIGGVHLLYEAHEELEKLYALNIGETAPYWQQFLVRDYGAVHQSIDTPFETVSSIKVLGSQLAWWLL